MGKRSQKSKSKKERKNKRRRRHSSTNSLGRFPSLLSWGLLSFPQLLQELPPIIAALDSGQSVNIDGISNVAIRSYLVELMKFLPVANIPGDGYSKDEEIKSISGYILHKLLEAGSIVQPSSLSSTQLQASRSVTSLLGDVLSKFPELTSEMPQLLLSFSDGDSVCLGSIDNADVRECLVEFFESVGAEIDDEGAHSIGENAQSIKEALRHLITAFDCAKAYAPLSSAVLSSPTNGDSSSSSLRSSDSSSEDDEVSSHHSEDDELDVGHNDNNNGDNDHRPRLSPGAERSRATKRARIEMELSTSAPRGKARVQGPSMPSVAQLTSAQAAAKKYIDEGGLEDSDDEFGPAPRLLSTSPTSTGPTANMPHPSTTQSHGVPLNAVVGLVGATGSTTPSVPSTDTSYANVSRENEQVVREEWMLNPGEDRPIAGFESFGTSRKFQSGKQAKKRAEVMAALREEAEKADENSEARQRTKEIFEQYRELRGPSLMEQHEVKLASKPKPVNTERRPFDREKDVLSRHTIGSQQVQELVQKAKELDSRFDKGSMQRSFL